MKKKVRIYFLVGSTAMDKFITYCEGTGLISRNEIEGTVCGDVVVFAVYTYEYIHSFLMATDFG